MTDFEILNTDDIEFREEDKEEDKNRVEKPVAKSIVNTASQKEAIRNTSGSVSSADDYKSVAGKPRIYEVVIETVSYTKGGRRVNYSHTIKYPGHQEYFDEVEL